ncbi:hypothetical protein E3N88_39250 [Mikania micrantha]|uniref:Uncharacterized protein n=1 Tax=Mikania micrantha TaxID=192012 RepID=A0A5N6LW84_9ASTR|nr:hypothetical protein E3N88_39250 [Mikania micrantha]
MEVVPPANPTDFDFNSSAYATAPLTPRLIIGAPTRSISGESYREFDQLMSLDDSHQSNCNSQATVPFAWEEKPGVPKSTTDLFTKEFAFHVGGESYVSADDLFHGGMIMTKPLDIEPPSATMQNKNLERERGRERNSSGLPSSRSRRTRSLPPIRAFEQPPALATATANTTPPTFSSTSAALSASGSGKGSKKWSFKDLFLFRSASDGRALDRDPLKKYSATFRKHDEDCRNSNLGDRSGSGSGSKRRGRVSAHELHYTVNRAVSNDMKKKTFLPYKQGILGRLAFNPTVHALSNGFGSFHNN